MHFALFFGRTVAVLAASLAASTFSAGASPLTWNGALVLEQGYDSNVFLQSQGSDADIGAWVTTASSPCSAVWKPDDELTASFTYAPSATHYHGATSENYVAHRLNLSTDVSKGWITLQLTGSGSLIDGSDEGLVWTAPGGAPATGAPALRDRRDQLVLRATARASWKKGDWTVRPLASFYAADFQTVQKTTPGYQNYVDRSETVVGCDALRTVRAVQVGLSYRHGSQDQVKLFEYPEEYDNTFERVLLLLDGKLTPWLTASVQAGPEFHRYGRRVPASFGDHDHHTFYSDATLTAAVSTDDSVIVSCRRFEMVSSSGRGAFDDLNLDAGWRHALSKSASVTLGFHAYNTAFLAPARRDDWVLTWRVSASVILTEKWKCDASILHDTGHSQVPGTSGRDYARSFGSVAVRRAF